MKRLPIVRFVQSGLYDAALIRNPDRVEKPDEKLFEQRIKRLKKRWAKHGKKILRAIAHVIGMRWHERDINVYLTWGVRSYSDPLTANVMQRRLIDVLTHELIHRILSEPENRMKEKVWRKFTERYAAETRVARIHVAIHAIHQLVILKLFGKARLEREIRSCDNYLDYKRAWELVARDGAGAIVASLRP